MNEIKLKSVNWTKKLFLGTLILGLGACTFKKEEKDNGKSEIKVGETALRATSSEENTEDFDAIASGVEKYYGPYEFKERRFGYKIKDLAREYREKVSSAQSEAEAFGYYAQFLGALRDGHVSIRPSSVGEAAYNFKTPNLVASPIGDRFILAVVDPSLAIDNIAVGDELLTVDDQPPRDLALEIAKYQSVGNDLSDLLQSARIFNRPAWMHTLKPTRPYTEIQIKKSNGLVLKKKLIWKKEATVGNEPKLIPYGTNQTQISTTLLELKEAGLESIGAVNPFFANNIVRTVFGLKRVRPTAETMAEFKVSAPAVEMVYSGIYKYQGKTILLVRNPSYAPSYPDLSELVRAYAAVLYDYKDLADVLVIDQTHNPGGSVQYVLDLFSLYSKQQAKSMVQFFNADRKWMSVLAAEAAGLQATNSHLALIALDIKNLIESSYDQGMKITPTPVGFNGEFYLDAKAIWSKPILVLIDQVSGSGGDAFPMLMKANGVAKLFGQRTMGLGGNVEAIVTLPVSGGSVRLTRGLFTTYSPEGEYPDNTLIENNGVTPDISYEHNIEDARRGYVNYFNTFSSEAIKLLATP